MELYFLTPVTAVVAAAITIPALIALYMLKLRRRPVRVSSVLFWRDPGKPLDREANVPLRWPRPTANLLVQLIGAALLCAALGRPATRGTGEASPRVVILIDASASMSSLAPQPAAGPGISRLDEAKRAAKEACASLLAPRPGRETKVMVASFARDLAVKTGFVSGVREAHEAIDLIEPTDQAGDAPRAIESLGAVVTQAREREREFADDPAKGAADLIIFSDGAFAQGELSAPDNMRVSFRSAATRAESRPPAWAENAGIVSFAASRAAGEPELVRVFARLAALSASDSGSPERITRTVTLGTAAGVVARRAITMTREETDSGAGMVGPYSSTFVAEARIPLEGPIVLSIDQQDALGSDNTAVALLPPAAGPKILMVVPDGEPLPQEDDRLEGQGWAVYDVLRELNTSDVRAVHLSAYERFAGRDVADTFGMIVFDRVRPISPSEIPSISFGISPWLDGSGAMVGHAPEPIIWWKRGDRLLSGVSLDALQVPASMGSGAGEQAGTFEGVARTRLGPAIVVQPAVFVPEPSPPRIAVLFEVVSSGWMLDPGFAVFLSNAMGVLITRGSAGDTGSGPDPEESEWFTTGSSIILGGLPRSDSYVVDGAGSRATVNPIGTGSISIAALPRVGLYNIEPGERRVAVNLMNAAETLLPPTPALRVGGAVLDGSADAAPVRELWRWALLWAFALLMGEWLLGGLGSRVRDERSLRGPGSEREARGGPASSPKPLA